MEKEIKAIAIEQKPFITSFNKNGRILFFGLLCRNIYTDGSWEYNTEPFLDYPQPEEAGEYICTIYPNRDNKNISTSFKFKIMEKN